MPDLEYILLRCVIKSSLESTFIVFANLLEVDLELDLV
jgi:hypothetical protein